MRKVTEATRRGQSFTVVKNSKAVFQIVPLERVPGKKYTLKDVLKIRFRSKDKNLSKNIDKIVYDI